MEAVKAIEPHVECPICTEIPRDGVMLQCANGHNVCAVCKNKLGEAVCPMGRYEYCYSGLLLCTVCGKLTAFTYIWTANLAISPTLSCHYFEIKFLLRVIYQLLNLHLAYGQISKYTHCRCAFGTPPAQNPTVASLIRSFFEWPCKYQAAASCEFEGAGPELAAHEDACKRQLVICPKFECGLKIISFGTIVEHLGSTHNIIGKVNIPSANQGTYDI
jgi:hypothetical protein